MSANPRAGLRGSFDASEEVALDVWAPGARCIVNEPLFVPSPGGWPCWGGTGGWHCGAGIHLAGVLLNVCGYPDHAAL